MFDHQEELDEYLEKIEELINKKTRMHHASAQQHGPRHAETMETIAVDLFATGGR